MKHLTSVFSACLLTLTLIFATAARANSDFSAQLSSVSPNAICQNASATLHFSFGSGVAPFWVGYTDGENLFTFSCDNMSADILVSPAASTTYTLVFADDDEGSSASVSGSATLSIVPAPHIVSDLSTTPMFVCNGDALSIGIEAEGNNLSYQWYKDGQPIFDNETAQNPWLSIDYFGVEQSGAYSCMVYGSCAEQGISSSTLNIQAASGLQLTTDLNGGTVQLCRGSDLTLTIAADGASLSYQWRHNGVAIENNESATSPTLVLTKIQDEQTGSYDCMVNTSCGNLTMVSQSEQVLLINPVSILSQPESQTVCAQSTVVFSVEAEGTNPSYTWRKDGVVISNNETASSANLVLENLQTSDAGVYDVVITNSCESTRVVSASATLSVNAALHLSAVKNEVSACRQSTAMLHADVTGQDPRIQWRVRGEDIIDNPTAKTPTLVLNDLNDDMSGIYTVVVTDLCSEAQSVDIELNVYAPVKIERQSSNLVVCEGGTVHADVIASGSVGRYQWYLNGVALNRQTSATLDIVSMEAWQSGMYTCVVSGAVECQPSDVESYPIQILALPATRIIKQPSDAVAALNGSAIFYVQSSGTGNVIDMIETYQWYKDEQLLADNDHFLGTHTAQLEIRDITSIDALSRYSCRVHGACGNVVSASAAIVIPPVVISRQPQSVSACVGSRTELAGQASTTADVPMTYQWYKDAKPIPGATQPVYTFASMSGADNGLYKLAFILGYKVTVFSNEVPVTAVERLVLDMSTEIHNQQSCSGSYLELHAPVLAGTGLSYQWYLNNIAVDGANAEMYVDYSVQPSRAGEYSVMVSNSCLSQRRVVAQLNVSDWTTITEQPKPVQNLYKGQSFTLHVAAKGSSLQYRWKHNGTEIPGAISDTYTASANNETAGYYTVSVFSPCGVAYSEYAEVIVLDVAGLGESVAEQGWTLSEPRPNPADRELRYTLSTTQSSEVWVELYSITGQCLYTNSLGFIEAGEHNLRLDEQIARVPSGTYAMRLRTASGVLLQRSVVVLH